MFFVFFYCIYKDVSHIFFSRIQSCFLRMGCKALWYYEFDMHSNVKSPRGILWLQAGGMDFMPTGHRPIKSRHFYQAGDNTLFIWTDQNNVRLWDLITWNKPSSMGGVTIPVLSLFLFKYTPQTQDILTENNPLCKATSL